ncbi:hypothetical protein [Streptomyces sp. NPDC058579]|uniref:hypothetical protein n=1 Tax=Streptomyces sp. NPDC058579 TaxID=3346548 RepID=UPI00365D62E3
MMKSLKAAAVLAGFAAIAGAAAPAHADGPMPTSVDGGLNTLLSQPTLDVTPVSTSTLDIGEKESAGTVKQATDGTGDLTQLLGGLPLAN